MRILRSRLLANERDKAAAETAATRRAQVGTGDRSEKVRTYNYSQNRVTDHRIGVSVHDIDAVMQGGITPFVDALIEEERAALLASSDLAPAATQP